MENQSLIKGTVENQLFTKGIVRLRHSNREIVFRVCVCVACVRRDARSGMVSRRVFVTADPAAAPAAAPAAPAAPPGPSFCNFIEDSH